jgi:hypothetical protein
MWFRLRVCHCHGLNDAADRPANSSTFDDDVLNEDWIKNRMVRSHVSAVTVAVLVAGYNKRKRNEVKHTKKR